MNALDRAWTLIGVLLPAAAMLSCGGGGGSGPSCELPAGTVPTPGAYHIDLRFQGIPTADQQAAFEAAAARLEAIVTTTPGLHTVTWNAANLAKCANPTSVVTPGSSEDIDGLVIFASVEDLGSSGILAESGPCIFRPKTHLPAAAVMIFNSEFLDTLTVDNLRKTVQHEMLHTLGFGINWEPTCNLLAGVGHRGTSFTGPQAVRAAKVENFAPPSWKAVPVEDCAVHPGSTCGAGTVNSHWRYAAFSSATQRELMTGWIDTNHPEPLSATTVASLQDLGYSVDLTQADPYTIPSVGAAALEEEVQPQGIWLGDDVWRVDPADVPEP